MVTTHRNKDHLHRNPGNDRLDNPCASVREAAPVKVIPVAGRRCELCEALRAKENLHQGPTASLLPLVGFRSGFQTRQLRQNIRQVLTARDVANNLRRYLRWTCRGGRSSRRESRWVQDALSGVVYLEQRLRPRLAADGAASFGQQQRKRRGMRTVRRSKADDGCELCASSNSRRVKVGCGLHASSSSEGYRS